MSPQWPNTSESTLEPKEVWEFFNMTTGAVFKLALYVTSHTIINKMNALQSVITSDNVSNKDNKNNDINQQPEEEVEEEQPEQPTSNQVGDTDIQDGGEPEAVIPVHGSARFAGGILPPQ